MASKDSTKQIKLQIKGGQANPAPPVGPALGQVGVNIMDFCKQFNDATKSMQGEVVPVIITVNKDKTFSFAMKKPPASNLLKKIANLASGSGEPNKKKVGKITRQQLIEVAKQKMDDLNTKEIDAACKILAGTARQMGLEIVD